MRYFHEKNLNLLPYTEDVASERPISSGIFSEISLLSTILAQPTKECATSWMHFRNLCLTTAYLTVPIFETGELPFMNYDDCCQNPPTNEKSYSSTNCRGLIRLARSSFRRLKDSGMVGRLRVMTSYLSSAVQPHRGFSTK